MSEKLKNSTESFNSKPYYIIIGILGIGILGVGLFLIFTRLTTPEPTNVLDAAQAIEQDENFDGSTMIDPPREMPDFTLINQNGEPLSLSDMQGKPVLLSFGYTNCPDVCPLTLNEYRQIQEELEELGDEVTFVFISVDGQRDTPEMLKRYFAVRGIDDFIGLTGEEADLRRLGVNYGLYFEYGEPDENGYYLVDHTASSFLLDANSNWIMSYAFGTDRTVIVEDLRELINLSGI